MAAVTNYHKLEVHFHTVLKNQKSEFKFSINGPTSRYQQGLAHSRDSRENQCFTFSGIQLLMAISILWLVVTSVQSVRTAPSGHSLLHPHITFSLCV